MTFKRLRDSQNNVAIRISATNLIKDGICIRVCHKKIYFHSDFEKTLFERNSVALLGNVQPSSNK